MGTFNHEKGQVEAFSMIVKTDDSFASLSINLGLV